MSVLERSEREGRARQGLTVEVTGRGWQTLQVDCWFLSVNKFKN